MREQAAGRSSSLDAATIGHVVRASQAGLVQYFPDLRPVLVNADAGSPDGTQRVVGETEPPDYIEQILLVRPTNRLARVSLTYPALDGVGGKGAALRTLFEMAAALKVEALGVGLIHELIEEDRFVMTVCANTEGNILSWLCYVRCGGHARLHETVSAIDPGRGTQWNNMVGRAHRLHPAMPHRSPSVSDNV